MQWCGNSFGELHWIGVKISKGGGRKSTKNSDKTGRNCGITN